MKYTSRIVINRPRQRVVELFDDPENLPKWMAGLRSFEHISGEPGQPGAKSRLVFDQGDGSLEMIETVTRRDLPDEFAGTFETDGVCNSIVNRFVEDGPQSTRWISENEFRFEGFMRFAAFFMQPLFWYQSKKFMRAFKQFVESSPVDAAGTEAAERG